MVDKQDRSKRLAALRGRMKSQEFSGGGAGFLSMAQGVNTIRILPEVGDMEFFFQPVGRHYFPGSERKKYVYCPRFTSEGKLPCPVCELVDDLYKQGDKEMGKELRLSRQWWMNVINRKDQKAGPLIFTPGETIYQAITGYVSDSDYGDIFDPEEGCDIKVERDGVGIDTEYQVRTGKPGPLAVTEDGEIDEALINQWLEKAKDLSYVEVSDDPEEDKDLSAGHAVYLLPYDRIVKEFHLEGDLNWEDEDAEKKPAKPVAKSTRPAHKAVEDDDETEAPRARRSLRR